MKKRLGAPRAKHIEEKAKDDAHARSTISSAHKMLDVAERGDVYACDDTLRQIINIADVQGGAYAHARSANSPKAKLQIELHNPQIDKDFAKLQDRFKKVCMIPRKRS